MYHEVTYDEEREARRWHVANVAVVVLLVACVLAVSAVARSLSREQGAVALRADIMRGALQCNAVEGSYPTSVDYLVERYGLVINEGDYVVLYEWVGDNIPPSVVVRPA